MYQRLKHLKQGRHTWILFATKYIYELQSRATEEL
jgi:hypothetical protein